MKLKFLILSTILNISVSSAIGQVHHLDTIGFQKLGLHGCIPADKIILLATGKFQEIKDNGKYYIYFLGGTIHRNGDVKDAYDRDNIYFGSETSVVGDWNDAISGEDLTKLGIGLESKLITTIGKDYFKLVTIWIGNDPVFSNLPEKKK